MSDNYKICQNCVLDNSEPSLVLDSIGNCQYCNKSLSNPENKQLSKESQEKLLQAQLKIIKSKGERKEYDCIIGLSGGVDSSYVAYLVKKIYGLRPLAVHLDNGWNDELAVANIENICKKLDIDLYTHVINWNEFRDLQLSFLKASVANAEAPTDHAIFATLYNLAIKYKIAYIIDGVNKSTEFSRPEMLGGGYRYDDLKQILSIHKIFGTQKLKTYPKISIWKKFFLKYILGVKQFSILDYVNYDKEFAKKILIDELGWKSYGGKHHESIFTKWHQVVYLPKKFGYDKRRVHLSDMILSGQISRNEAIDELKKPILTVSQIEELERYVIKKLNISEEEYLQILKDSPKSYKDYPNDEFILELFKRIKY